METALRANYSREAFKDEELVKLLPGFTNGNTTVNDINIHYVEGGQGQPLVLIPGWPETWWAFHQMMPLLAEKYHVIVVDMRGMGSSDKPEVGYDKKTMAKDIFELIKHLGYDQVNIGGHDIGAQVAFSFAANYPEATTKLIMLDTPHPNAGMYYIPLVPAGNNSLVNEQPKNHMWWMAFNQVKGLPEQLLIGRSHLVHNYVFKYASVDENSINEFDRAVYLEAYDNADGIRAGNGWYQTFAQDIEDSKSYTQLNMPVLGVGGSGFELLARELPPYATNLKVVKIEGSGHFILEEKPKETVNVIVDFLN
ncbi:alpha/beta fold hydrolase [Pedobacter antarcticus]|uniref:alpha/beta fold hydrolase n=1 Tax=Pedobacter antarcticus TaxID=34086 RepID=UPI001C59F251|nr:alpha/beta hydrolase [Pedobacter antarcticus]